MPGPQASLDTIMMRPMTRSLCIVKNDFDGFAVMPFFSKSAKTRACAAACQPRAGPGPPPAPPGRGLRLLYSKLINTVASIDTQCIDSNLESGRYISRVITLEGFNLYYRTGR